MGYEPRKNIPLLIEAFSQLETSFGGINLVLVVAEAESRNRFRSLVTDRYLDDRVIILAELPPKTLVVLYNLAELFVFTSERESFGLPPLEALACGAPTIAMNMTSLPEVLGDGALLIDGKDVGTWANAIERVLTDNDFRKDSVSRGLQQAAKLTWQRCAQETLEVYHAVAEES